MHSRTLGIQRNFLEKSAKVNREILDLLFQDRILPNKWGFNVIFSSANIEYFIHTKKSLKEVMALMLAAGVNVPDFQIVDITNRIRRVEFLIKQ
jgi:hypothetical protein